jgi:hypothetical protein
LSDSKWFSNYNLDSRVEVDLAETKIEHFLLAETILGENENQVF